MLAVTHDRWFARGFDRFLVFRADGKVVAVATSRSGTRAGSAGSADAVRRASTRRRRLSGPRGGDDTGGMDPQRNKERTLDAVAALNRGDVEGYLAIYAPGAVVHGLPEHVTPDPRATATCSPTSAARCPTSGPRSTAVVAEGDLLAATGHLHGDPRGTMMGVAPTGRVLTWDAMTFRRFDEEGRVVERWIIGDDLALLHQLGLV